MVVISYRDRVDVMDLAYRHGQLTETWSLRAEIQNKRQLGSSVRNRKFAAGQPAGMTPVAPNTGL